MAERKPVVLVGGQLKELPAGDTLPPQAPAAHSHATSDVTGLDAALSGKEPTISAGTSAQYWRGDKTWRDFSTDVRAATLTGLSTATNSAVTEDDTVLVAHGKLQAQASHHFSLSENAHPASAISVAAVEPATSNSIPAGTVQELLAINWQDVGGLLDWQSFHTSGAGTQHPASTISNTPSGGVAATTVQGAINELDAEKASAASVREKLTAARTYYVRTDGSDSNSGLTNTSGGAFLTIQKAVDVCAALDFNGFSATVQVGDGTWTAPATVSSTVNGVLTIAGNATTPDNVLWSLSSGSCLTASGPGVRVVVKDMKLQTGGAAGVVSSGRASVTATNCTFGACGYAHITGAAGGAIVISTSCRIVGSAPSFANLDNANIDMTLCAFTLTGTPAFSTAFITAQALSYARCVLPTFSGAATGSRYSVSTNSVINVNAAGETFLPGNAAGTKTTGGEYQ